MRRSPREIAFRARQEIANLRLWLAPPRLAGAAAVPSPLPQLPDPATVAPGLRGSELEREIGRLAEGILAHRFPVLGYEIDPGTDIDWRRDYVHGQTSGTAYFRRIPYLDFAAAGDHKVIWELNRHQHLVTLAQSWLLTGREDAIPEITGELESWWEQNPLCCGINWASALEVAFRALSWVWVWHLAGKSFEPAFARRFLESLYQHGCYLRENLSVYFSPNTHLLGEAVALHALGKLFPEWAASEQWRRLGRKITVAEMDAQTFPDGAHFEKSTYYHVYALDLFLLHAILEAPPPAYLERLAKMADFLHAIAGPAWEIALLGDDDGGRLFHPYGVRSQFGRGTLATSAAYLKRPELVRDAAGANEAAVWYLGPERAAQGAAGQPFTGSRLFRESGLAVMGSGETQLIADVRAFGAAGAGHSHAHALSLVCRQGSRELLVDPGTYTYVADPAWRAEFRGTGAHNTLRIDGADQADAAGPFRWAAKPETAIREWASTAESDYLDAECRYRGFVHRRRILFRKPGLFVVVDSVEGPSGEHTVEGFWHLADEPALDCISMAGDAEFSRKSGWRSRVFGRKEAIPVLIAGWRGSLPVVFCTVIDTAGRQHTVAIARHDGSVIEVDGERVPLGAS